MRLSTIVALVSAATSITPTFSTPIPLANSQVARGGALFARNQWHPQASPSTVGMRKRSGSRENTPALTYGGTDSDRSSLAPSTPRPYDSDIDMTDPSPRTTPERQHATVRPHVPPLPHPVPPFPNANPPFPPNSPFPPPPLAQAGHSASQPGVRHDVSAPTGSVAGPYPFPTFQQHREALQSLPGGVFPSWSVYNGNGPERQPHPPAQPSAHINNPGLHAEASQLFPPWGEIRAVPAAGQQARPPAQPSAHTDLSPIPHLDQQTPSTQLPAEPTGHPADPHPPAEHATSHLHFPFRRI